MRNTSIKIYSWNIDGLSGSSDTGLLKRMDLKRMFREGRQELKTNTSQIVFIALTGIHVKDYSELSFRLQEFDVTKEIEKYGYDYFWTPSSTHEGGLVLFWKAVDSTQVMISDKGMTTS